jgi:hypothetical protein
MKNVIDGVIADVESVSHDADRHHGQDVAQIPVGPIVSSAGPNMIDEEIPDHRVEDVDESLQGS